MSDLPAIMEPAREVANGRALVDVSIRSRRAADNLGVEDAESELTCSLDEEERILRSRRQAGG